MSTQNPSPENQPTPKPQGDAVGLVSSDLLGVRPARELVPLYESRLRVAEMQHSFWRDEFAKHGDPISESAWRSTAKTVSDVWSKLHMLKQPGAVVRGSA